MTPGARAAGAIELLDAILADTSQPADRIVAGWFRRRRYAGGGDRAAISRIVFTVFRRRAQIDWWLESRDSRGRVIAALLLGEGWSMADLAAAFDGGRYRPSPLAETERKLAGQLAGKQFDHPDQTRPVRGNYPDWLDRPLGVVLGGALETETAALLDEAPVDLRVNTLRCDRAEAIEALARDGIAAVPTPLSPVGLRLDKRAPLSATAAWRGGLIEVQDEASQIAALLVGARPGEAVADFCAGAGGKTLALAAAMENRGRLAACDISGPRLSRAAPRLKRAGVTIVESHTLVGAHDAWIERREAAFDRVLVDAPCTGTGAWRRNPDAKWRLAPDDLARFVTDQASILERAARLVAPSGRLIYTVCSLLGEEGEAQIAGFLSQSPDFEALPITRIWAEIVGGSCPAGDVHLRLMPGRDGVDGFFISVLRRG
jgi:16S rRNA (cytosine967-C5)-methyltransferase